jgi:hypothetical protein
MEEVFTNRRNSYRITFVAGSDTQALTVRYVTRDMTQDAQPTYSQGKQVIKFKWNAESRAKEGVASECTKGIKLERVDINQLLDVGAFASGVTTNIAFATGVAPATVAALDTDGFLCDGEERVADGFVAMDANQVTTQVVLAAERAPA